MIHTSIYLSLYLSIYLGGGVKGSRLPGSKYALLGVALKMLHTGYEMKQ